jgi:hypothetical protein
MESIIAIIALLAVIGYQGWFIRDAKMHWTETEKNLLDRLMVRNWETLVQGESVRAEVKKSLTDEEIMELQTERGIPV